jgi:hypothetical protein
MGLLVAIVTYQLAETKVIRYLSDFLSDKNPIGGQRAGAAHRIRGFPGQGYGQNY